MDSFSEFKIKLKVSLLVIANSINFGGLSMAQPTETQLLTELFI